MPAYYPVFLDLRDRKCVVVGGGKVAERKVHSLLECLGKVTVVSREATPGIEALASEGRITWQRRKFITGDLMGAFVAIAATDDTTVNKKVAAEAEQLSVLLNVVDVTPLCSFIAPSVVKRGEITIATSTGGASPALARKLREELSRSRILEYADLAPLLSWARKELRRRGVAVDPDHWQRCITEELLDLVQQGRTEEAETWLMSHLLEGQAVEAADP